MQVFGSTFLICALMHSEFPLAERIPVALALAHVHMTRRTQ